MRKRNQPENHHINKKRPCTTTLKMNLLSSLVLSWLLFRRLFSCLVSPLPSSLSLCPCLLSLSVSGLCGLSFVLSLSLESVSVSVSLKTVSVSVSVSVCCCVLVCVVCAVWCVACDTMKNSVCPLNTSPCVRSKRPRVYRHHAHTCFNMCARGARTHGDALNLHAVKFFIGKTCDF